ncbi:MAG TPA: flagellar M-ring protein FliF, partial [Thermodesulfobacteriaceae bacterium]|nr:flagellar M-ring protein FliF [Thermodesulfobacteriaceae bacterium]
DATGSLSSSQLSYQKNLEQYYKRKIQSMLGNALGPDKAIVRVTADIDFDRIDFSEERYDPDTVAIRSEQKILETVSAPAAGGIPGIKGGLADKLQGNLEQKQAGKLKQKKKDITNYEITRSERHVNGSIGKLKRLSVGVLVDGTYSQDKAGKEVYTPRNAEELKKLQQIVRAAIGFNEDRGDEISIVNMAFNSPAAEEKSISTIMDTGMRFAKPFSNLILAVLFIFLVIRPLLNRFILKPEPGRSENKLALEGEGEAGALEGQEVPGLEAPPPFQPLPNAHDELRELASDYPERAAALVKIWLREKQDSEGEDLASA